MVSSLLADALRDPTSSLSHLYPSTGDKSNFPALVSRHYSQIFKTQEAFEEIPTLDVNYPPKSHQPRSLVRFRAMVQDTSPSPEMYLSEVGEGACGGWGMDATLNESEIGILDYSKLKECTVVWAVNVPGETDWCKQKLDGAHPDAAREVPTPVRTHKFPVGDVPHVGIQVKIYDKGDTLKSTDVVTFVGILTTESTHSDLDESISVPTLHVLFWKSHPRTLLPRSYPVDGVDGVRGQLISWIATEALGGDTDAAEWILLVCIARTISRHPALLQPSLTISHFPLPTTEITTPTLSHVLSELLPSFLTLPLSLDLLNKLHFAPESKDEDLHSGFLQQPAGTTILVNESGVQEGKLAENGINNILITQDVMSSQTIPYIFPFSRFSFPTDINFVVLAQGKKSAFFKTDIGVELKRRSSDVDLYKPKDRVGGLSSEILDAFRELIGSASSGTVKVGPTMSAYIQNAFVEERQKSPSITQDHLIHMMTVAKLMALSMHATELTPEIWERTKTLESRRASLS
ncbi:hypothetical protein JAAARDRAFT_31540 [Jaapia argillacea MUCL 33604]|uniref:Mini-chromosome maintenance complex-binding protein n=1 Tax=Jaapia argillacea MUCL 33604 TaxID=933084 RepID=A0A067Q0T7_9AGAM|nr:hypothetical protein JAAARDRAFT_31540 [Jaapia argillacea MUCL 33604]